jgi:hypothetical protein
MVCAAGVLTTVGLGFTSTLAVMGVPAQLVTVGVMVKVTFTGSALLLVSAPRMSVSDDPVASKPVTVPTLSLDQLNMVPGRAPVKLIRAIVAPEQMFCAAGVAAAFMEEK